MRFLMMVLVLAAAFGCSGGPNSPKPIVNASNSTPKPAALPVWSYDIINTYPHDPKAFTQGLFYHDGFLYESTGGEEAGRSSIRKVELESGKVLQKWELPAGDFGEGAAIVNDKIYQLTWHAGLCRVFDAKTFKVLKELRFQGEGWGLTTDGSALYMSQGTHVLKVMNAETFDQAQTIPVMREDGKPLMKLNELEWVKGEIWSNVWHSEQPDILGKPNYIARIEPATGKLLGWIDLAGISPEDQSRDSENTLNGIAYDRIKDRVFVTGKNWKNLYEIKIKIR